ncbi:VOC family protein [Neobacillus vireti]|uniref:Ring-cleavage extradiol dioxygenase n=1 Tax=Neobacillus vireti LMG 21834 TaxID=1131730 RepID=A0AB94INV7_9BACI|nr:ring-cleavage extradiol dioxygenase [Neobacillus vireti]ETI68740.1 putative ring-cleavage extradiol dioxygenase [Neobacillus vireti LMG 21834]KLT18724.1 ring-cleavage extradiol dioxygenase [Neobacillus vireti]
MNITELILLTNKINEMRDFYKNILELQILRDDSNIFTVQLGSTAVTFRETQSDSNPFYHFAINIPENKMEDAKSWIKSKVALNTEEDSDEVFFKSWNAHAIYFEDPSENIIEFIARHNLRNGVEHNFSSDDLVNISEVGLVVDEVIPFVRKLNEIGIPNWRDDSEGLTPVGDENGLFITVKNGRRWFFSNKDAKFYPFEVSIEGIGKVSFHNKKGEVLIKK